MKFGRGLKSVQRILRLITDESTIIDPSNIQGFPVPRPIIKQLDDGEIKGHRNIKKSLETVYNILEDTCIGYSAFIQRHYNANTTISRHCAPKVI